MNNGMWERQIDPGVLNMMWSSDPSSSDPAFSDLLAMWRKGEAPANLLGQEIVKMDIAAGED
jgi:hypothetical protein